MENRTLIALALTVLGLGLIWAAYSSECNVENTQLIVSGNTIEIDGNPALDRSLCLASSPKLVIMVFMGFLIAGIAGKNFIESLTGRRR